MNRSQLNLEIMPQWANLVYFSTVDPSLNTRFYSNTARQPSVFTLFGEIAGSWLLHLRTLVSALDCFSKLAIPFLNFISNNAVILDLILQYYTFWNNARYNKV